MIEIHLVLIDAETSWTRLCLNAYQFTSSPPPRFCPLPHSVLIGGDVDV